MSTENLATWNALERTDPRHVKEITGKTYKGNSPRPQYVIWKLTEMFGPVGQGFGWTVVHEAYIDGAPHQDGTEKMHECRIRFWAKSPDCAVDSYGCTKALYKAKGSYWVSDEDAAKKSLTDAIVKAASWLGVAGDIFMGRWDDSKYVEELKAEARQPTPALQPTQRPVAPPHDPETGEVAPDHSATMETDSAGLAAWKDGVFDALPPNADTKTKASALARQFITDLDKYKAETWLERYIASRRPVIDWLEGDEDLRRDLHEAMAAARGRVRGEDPRDFAPIGSEAAR